MAVYYQTYRPQKFSQVVGQTALIKALQGALKQNRLGHAYLFCGSRGVGKTTVARLLAKAANCTKLENGEVCDKCSNCSAVTTGNFLDVIEIDAASHTGVDNIRELIERINFQPTQGRTKVFIIDEVHMLSKAAFNALLKTLEEPPSHALFILATTDIDKVPETIISRAQRFDFKKISDSDILHSLEQIVKQEKLKLPKGTLELIAQNSQGGLRDALSQLSMVAFLEKDSNEDDIHLLLGTTPQKTVKELLGFIAVADAKSIPNFYNQLNATGFDPQSFTRSVLEFLQELIEQHFSGIADKDVLAQSFNLTQLLHITRLFLRAYKELEHSLSGELPLLLASIEAALYMSGSNSAGGQSDSNSSSVNKDSSQDGAVNLQTSLVSSLKVKEVVTTSVNSVSSQEKISNFPTLQITVEQVQAWWPALVEEVRKLNSPLATLLKNSPISDVSGNKIAVSVKYLFHKEQLESVRLKQVITEFLSKQAGGAIIFTAVIDKGLSVGEQITDTATAVTDALKIFGGELVE